MHPIIALEMRSEVIQVEVPKCPGVTLALVLAPVSVHRLVWHPIHLRSSLVSSQDPFLLPLMDIRQEQGKNFCHICGWLPVSQALRRPNGGQLQCLP